MEEYPVEQPNNLLTILLVEHKIIIGQKVAICPMI